MNLDRKDFFSIPNCLSYLRLILIPFFIVTYMGADTVGDYYKAALIIFISSLTDLADGYIARHFKQITELGKLLDPVADKLSQGAIVFCLLYRYILIWPMVLLFIIKELSMGINGLVLLRRGRKLDGAKWFGKLSTAVFYICMFLLIAWADISYRGAMTLIGITFGFLFLSFVLYLRVFFGMYKA